MFKVANPQAVSAETVVGFRISANEFIYLPLDREARNALSKIANSETLEASWMTPYGDVVSLDEVDYGLYNVALNDEVVGTRIRADDVVKIIYVVENGRALIASRLFKRLPMRTDIENVRIGFFYKQKDGYMMVSLGRIQPGQIFELKKHGWEISQTHKIKTEDREVTIAAYTGLGACPALLDGNPMQLSDIVAELEDAGLTCYTLRDVR